MKNFNRISNSPKLIGYPSNISDNLDSYLDWQRKNSSFVPEFIEECDFNKILAQVRFCQFFPLVFLLFFIPKIANFHPNFEFDLKICELFEGRRRNRFGIYCICSSNSGIPVAPTLGGIVFHYAPFAWTRVAIWNLRRNYYHRRRPQIISLVNETGFYRFEK